MDLKFEILVIKPIRIQIPVFIFFVSMIFDVMRIFPKHIHLNDELKKYLIHRNNIFFW